MTRGIQEGDLVAVCLHHVSTDSLGNAAGLLGRHIGLADGIQEGGLAVVNVTHDADDRSSLFEGLLRLFVLLQQLGDDINLLFLLAENIEHQRDLLRLVIFDFLVNGNDLAFHEELLDDGCRLQLHLLCQLPDGQLLRKSDGLDDRLLRLRLLNRCLHSLLLAGLAFALAALLLVAVKAAVLILVCVLVLLVILLFLQRAITEAALLRSSAGTSGLRSSALSASALRIGILVLIVEAAASLGSGASVTVLESRTIAVAVLEARAAAVAVLEARTIAVTVLESAAVSITVLEARTIAVTVLEITAAVSVTVLIARTAVTVLEIAAAVSVAVLISLTVAGRCRTVDRSRIEGRSGRHDGAGEGSRCRLCGLLRCWCRCGLCLLLGCLLRFLRCLLGLGLCGSLRCCSRLFRGLCLCGFLRGLGLSGLLCAQLIFSVISHRHSLRLLLRNGASALGTLSLTLLARSLLHARSTLASRTLGAVLRAEYRRDSSLLGLSLRRGLCLPALLGLLRRILCRCLLRRGRCRCRCFLLRCSRGLRCRFLCRSGLSCAERPLDHCHLFLSYVGGMAFHIVIILLQYFQYFFIRLSKFLG